MSRNTKVKLRSCDGEILEVDDSRAGQLLFRLAEAVYLKDVEHAILVCDSMRGLVSQDGPDSFQRTAYYFRSALANRLLHSGKNMTYEQVLKLVRISRSCDTRCSQAALDAAFLLLNKVTPIVRFAHLGANQILLEVLEKEATIHIVDMNIMSGAQWSLFLTSLDQRCKTNKQPVPSLRITGVGPDPTVLSSTGDALSLVASSLHIPFQYESLPTGAIENLTRSMMVREGEATAIVCIYVLQSILCKGPAILRDFVNMLRSLGPKVVTVAEREANFNQAFLPRFVEALSHYADMFSALQNARATGDPDRRNIEATLFGSEINGVVMGDGDLSQTFESWGHTFQGLVPRHTSSTGVDEANQLLLRSEYTRMGYRVVPNENNVMLYLLDHPIFTVSGWQP